MNISAKVECIFILQKHIKVNSNSKLTQSAAHLKPVRLRSFKNLIESARIFLLLPHIDQILIRFWRHISLDIHHMMFLPVMIIKLHKFWLLCFILCANSENLKTQYAIKTWWHNMLLVFIL